MNRAGTPASETSAARFVRHVRLASGADTGRCPFGVTQSPITEEPDANVAVLVFRDPDNIQVELFAELSG